MCHGCTTVVEEAIPPARWPAGLRAHIPGWGSTGRACVSAEAPTTGIAEDTGAEEKPTRDRFEFDPEGGVWHACPAGPEAAPTIRFHCIADEQCTSRGDAYRHWRCTDGVCRPPVYCTSDDDCASGYSCLDGSEWEIDGTICRKPVPCVEYVGGICAPEGACRGRSCENLVLGCSERLVVPGGSGGCAGSDPDPIELTGVRTCTNLRPLQFDQHRYACAETAAVTCPGDRYCSPDTEVDALRCPVGSTCSPEPSGGTPWCAARELLNDAGLVALGSRAPTAGGSSEFSILDGIRQTLLVANELADYRTVDAVYQALNEDALRWAMEDLGAALTVPSSGHSFSEGFLPPEIFWRALTLADGTPVQGELVISIGQDDGGFQVNACGQSFDIIEAPWRQQVCAQPYYHDGRLLWQMQRKILVNPGTGVAPARETSCSACDDDLAGGRDRLEGALDGFAAAFEPLAGLLWSLAASEMSAPLVFGNWALFDALDLLRPHSTRLPPVTGDGTPDEVIGVRILDGKATLRALERCP
jgi:hypothetical protein